ncbi:MAG TPA: 3-isopropylmalate dehydratase small subunit [bacterium]|nr:3-isopropylmalate dehydratase small subunit [bacterium]
MIIRGRAHVVGHHVDTDVIIPARYLVTADAAELAAHVFEDLDPTLRERIGGGDILVAGENFGQGSSREHAPIAIKGAGIAGVAAISFARIFYRNAFNIGLPLLECPGAHGGVRDGDEVEIDFGAGTVRNVTRGERYGGQPIPQFMQQLVDAGGIVPYVRARAGRS